MKHTDIVSNSYLVQSYAKINLTLDVLGRQPSGYCEIATIMQTIDLYDTISLSTTDDEQVHLNCTRAGLATQNNLVVQAVQAVRQYLSIKQGVAIELHKRIPVAAGLGGGSSNAAATLMALQRWWQLPLTATELHDIAASLGSDVPFFLTGGLALCEGRGERITSLAAHWPTAMRWLVVLKPAIGVSTATVYRSLPSSDYTDGQSTRSMRAALEEKRDFSLDMLHNSLERGTLENYPKVAQARAAMLSAGASLVRLSGSGPTLFAPFISLDQAWQTQQSLLAQGYEVYLSRAIHPEKTDLALF